MKISPLDRKIVAALSKDARRSNRSIAEEVGVSDTYVRKRLLRLQQIGAIRIGAVSAILELDLNFVAEVMVSIAPGKIDEFIETIRQEEGATLISKISGKYNVLISITVSDIGEFNDILNKHIGANENVQDLTYSIVQNVYKHRSDIAAIRPSVGKS